MLVFVRIQSRVFSVDGGRWARNIGALTLTATYAFCARRTVTKQICHKVHKEHKGKWGLAQVEHPCGARRSRDVPVPTFRSEPVESFSFSHPFLRRSVQPCALKAVGCKRQAAEVTEVAEFLNLKAPRHVYPFGVHE